MGIIGQLRIARRTDESKNVFAFRVGVAVLVAVPFGSVRHFGEDQRRLQRVERLAFIKGVVQAVRPAAVNVRDILARAPLGHEPVRQFASPPGDRYNVNTGKLPLEILQQSFISINIDGDLPFFPGGCQGLLPVFFPIDLRGRGVTAKQQQCGQNRARHYSPEPFLLASLFPKRR